MKFTNVLTRVIVSFIAIPIILAIVFYGSYAFLGLVAIITFLAQYEFYKFSKINNIKHNYIIGYLFSLSILLIFYFNKIEFMPFVLFLALAFVTLMELFRKRNNSIINSSVSVFIPLLLSFFYSTLIGIREFFGKFESNDYIKGAYLVSVILAGIWICDSAAYFGGSALGKHRLLERISPKKSWEGAIFGFVFAIITVVIAKYWVLNFLDWYSIIYIGIVIGVIGQMGDLVESMFKRNSGVKDSSGLIPGHGGIYDRFDSLLYVAPFVYFYLKLFL